MVGRKFKGRRQEGSKEEDLRQDGRLFNVAVWKTLARHSATALGNRAETGVSHFFVRAMDDDELGNLWCRCQLFSGLFWLVCMNVSDRYDCTGWAICSDSWLG